MATDPATRPDDGFHDEIARRLARLEGPAPRGRTKWTPRALATGALLVLGLAGLVVLVPNRLFDPELRRVTVVIGGLAAWRFGWWFTHALRAEIRRVRVWPRLRAQREAAWAGGWRPPHLHVQMTTFREKPAITRHVIAALLSEIRRLGVPATIYVGTGTPFDERVITAIAEEIGGDLDADLVFIRQNQPGKRMAIGLVMRAIIRRRPDPEDVILFMDGDTVLGAGSLEKSIAMFGADPGLDALTTDEEVVCFGPRWMGKWLEMRFAQRRLAMQSHALSNRVLTLTGRMSVFRARGIVNAGFVRTIEADHLDHWLWGRFRFLSGDDKSTWYYLLSRGARMTYVPDARVYTVEVVEGTGAARMVQNLLRWSGNMLRNGARAIALGPRRMPLFIWWCLVDQRIAMWTMLVSPAIGIAAAFVEPLYLLSLMLWVMLSRVVLSLWLFRFARRVDWSWPFILYLNQVINAAVKVRLVYFLNRQSWANRGNQRAGRGRGPGDRLRGAVAWGQLAISVSLLFWAVGWMTGLPIAGRL
ncbi:glycosyltransferase [Rhodovulum marinum]|uniref:Glycosyltransferase Alg8 n=1 Tax=Rhodovulum marinum TaxID=320662 RepID=A0A4R2QBB7_9RHOB|nr:glycosyltransferase [Rhodovulum marinum]TCP44211.1 glycosyltransferase Alg8 [Rhodovulum marinum]